MNSQRLRRAVLAACRARYAAVDTPLVRPNEWDVVLDRSGALGVAAHFRGLPWVPRSASAAVDRIYYEQAARGAAIQAALGEVLDALRAAGVAAMPLKGAVMGPVVYGNVALRPMRDLDVLVMPADLDRAESVVRDLGYAPDEWYRPSAWYRAHAHHLVPLRRDDAVVELHHRPLPVWMPVAQNGVGVWRRAVEADIAGRPTQVPAPEDLLLQVAIEASGVDRFSAALKSFMDIAEIWRRYGESLDRDRFRVTAGPALRYAYVTLEVAAQLVAAPVPASSRAALRAHARVGWFELRMLTRLAATLATTPPGESPTGWPLRRRIVRELLVEKNWARRAVALAGHAVKGRWSRAASTA